MPRDGLGPDSDYQAKNLPWPLWESLGPLCPTSQSWPPTSVPTLDWVPFQMALLLWPWLGLAYQCCPLQVVRGRVCSSSNNWGCGSLLAS